MFDRLELMIQQLCHKGVKYGLTNSQNMLLSVNQGSHSHGKSGNVMEKFVIMESHGKVMENEINTKSHGKLQILP